MAQETYTHALKVRIGRVVASAIADNYFPMVGETVRIDATTKWGKTSEWRLQDGSGQTITEAGAIVSQKDGKAVLVTEEGDLKQVFIARNPLSETTVQKTVYAMRPQSLPYFDVEAAEVVRVGEPGTIVVKPENGYPSSLPRTMQARIYRENENTNPVKTLTFNSGSSTSSGFVDSFQFDEASDRGIYDVEIDVRDTTSGITFSKRINKLITVTPRLAPEPADRTTGYRDILATKSLTTYSGKTKVEFYIRLWENTGYGLSYAEIVIPAGEQNGTCYYDSIDISVLPAGTTLVLKDDPLEAAGYARRLLFKGNSLCSVSNASGTPNNTYEKPLIITINQDTVYHVPFKYYSGLNFENNCRHIVLDGRGYMNLENGIHIHKFDKDTWGSNCIFLVNGTGDVELIELELSDCDFTAISAKTDPDPNRPWYWFGNWEMNNLWLHHCHIHDTEGEGFYIGYFTPETKTGTNSKGEQVVFRAHALTNTRIYRNLMENMGYDGMQLSNARNAEVCYNTVLNASWRGEKDQSSGISIQSISGKCYNNIIRKFQGPALQIGPLGDLEVFNNIATDCPEGQPGIQFLFMVDCPEQNTNGTGANDNIRMYIHNNVIMCNGAGVNGRNTVQVKGLYFEDNILIYKSIVFGNMTAGTIEQWEAQASGNLLINQNIIDYVAIDAYKIADSANGDFRIAADSPLVQQGTGARFSFDFRGYKSWFPNVFPVGSYMGKFRDPNIEIVNLVLNSVNLNEGAANTYLPNLNVRLVYAGKANEYRVGLQADLSDAEWRPLADSITYTLNNTYGARTVYAQVKNATEVSEIVSSTIEFIYKPTILTGVAINNGAVSTIFDRVSVGMTYQLGRPSHYMISESETFAGASWQEFADTVDYTIAGDSRMVTLYVKIKEDDIESDTLSASIAYTSTLEYKDVTLRIPLSELGGAAGNVQAVMPDLKYGKRFAYSWTTDDSLIYVYSRMFNYINKKWVDDSHIYHDGMARTSGATPSRYLSYTDGCGRDVRFCLNSGFISHLNGKAPVLEHSYDNSQYFHLGEMLKFMDFGNGLQNHGAGGYNDRGAAEAIRICNEEVESKLGFTPFLLLFPGEEDADAFAAAGNANSDVYQMSSGIKNATISLRGLADSFFENKRSLMNRLTYDSYTLSQLKEKADYAYSQNNAHLMNMGGHNIAVGDSRFVDWEVTVKPFLDYLYDTYGKGGNDSVWFAPLEEIYEYIFTRHFSTVSVSNDGTDLILAIRVAGMKNFRQGSDVTIKLSGVDLSGVNTVTSDTAMYYLAKGLQADGSLLIQMNDNAGLNTLAEKYVAAFEAAPSQETMEDAEYMIGRLSASLRAAYQSRIDALNQPFGLKSITINSGAGETTKANVTVAIEYNGFVSPVSYRLGESADLSGATWIDYTDTVPFVLSTGLGAKTVYCQLKAHDGTLSSIKSDSIEVVESGARKAIVSLGWGSAEVPVPADGYYDSETGITRFQSQAVIGIQRKIYDTLGEQLGIAVPSTYNSSMVSPTNTRGTVTGDDSGVYPDTYLEHNSVVGANSVKSENITFTIPAGSYQIRLLCNTKWTQRVTPNEALIYKAVTDTDEVEFTLPESGVQNNTANLTAPVIVTVGASGMLKIEFGTRTAGTFYNAPLNIIEIEKV